MRKLLPILAVLLAICLPDASAQRVGPRSGTLMVYDIVDGDTVYYDVLSGARIIAARRGGSLKQYYKLIYNFNKVYPYALAGRRMMAQVDSTIAADVTRKSQRAAYINSVEKELLRLFEKDIRHMTISQGVLLLRLIDRECGKTGYEIIREYESKLAAGFWQVIARLFSQNLKSKYDPDGVDAPTEELIWIWDSGQWGPFYRSVWGEDPPVTVLPAERITSIVKK